MEGVSIAVIVPNWNDARHLPRCLNSVLHQGIPPDELLVVDDASTDDSVAVIQSLIRDQPRARFLANPVNLGTNRTINESLHRVQSEYVLLLSANDFVLPGIFERAKSCLGRSPGAGLWSAMAWLVDEEDNLIRMHPSPVVTLKDAYLPPERCARLAHRVGNWFTAPTLTYRRERLISVGGFDPRYGAPADFFTAVTVASLWGAACSPEPLAAFRIHRDSYSSKALNSAAEIERMLAHVRKRGPELSPRLFTADFCERIAKRYRFAAIRASEGELLPLIATQESGLTRVLLSATERVVPGRLHAIGVALAFLILRPFDVWPTLWHRALGWAVIRLRVTSSGSGAT